MGGDLLLQEDVVVGLLVDGEKNHLGRDRGLFAETDAQVPCVIFRFLERLELDQGERGEKKAGAGADAGKDDPPDDGVFFGGAGHDLF